MFPNAREASLRAYRSPKRVRSANRTLMACVNCKEKKLKTACLVEDPATRKHRPRNYLELLEQRVAFLEETLKHHRPDLANDHLFHSAPSEPDSQFNGPAASLPTEGSHSTHSRRYKDEEQRGETGLDELSSKVGLLSLSAAGAEPHYLGSSSTFAFSRLLNSSLRGLVAERHSGSALDQHSNNSPTHPIPCLLPDYGTAVTLSDAYFHNIHPQYPFLHEPTFREWELSIVSGLVEFDDVTSDPVALFFLHMAYSDQVLALDNIESIQAILCCAVYSLRSSIGTSHCWVYWNRVTLTKARKLAGLALRQCIDRGYHRNSKTFGSTDDPLQLELHRRVFWCTYAMESQAAIMLGRPQGIPYHEVDAEYPTDIDDADIPDSGPCYSSRQSPTDPPTSMTRAIHTFRIRHILAHLHTTLYSNSKSCCPPKHSHLEQVQKFRAEIENWRAGIPPLPPCTEALALFQTSDWFEMEYNYTILQLYRSQIIHHSGTVESVFLDCMRAAESICHSYRSQYLGKPTSYTWTGLHELFLAGLTFLHCLWTSPNVRDTYRQGRVSSVCTDCTIMLVLMAERWKAAAPYRDTFETLAKRTIMMMDDKPSGLSALSDATPEPQNSPEDGLAQWMALISDAGISEGYINGLLNSVVGDFPS
uniref:Xylanolytic transcriptional activator regulatory domain-containing protein n=2 Tax=Bionectria ochroleuca TaxID=29856 RepID=A0A0B7KEM6_BIOOC